MSKKINFFILPDELIELERYIVEEMQGVFILRASSVPDVIIINDIFNIPYLGSYICPKSELVNIKTKKIDANLYMIDSTSSPIMEFSQGIIKDGALRATRLLYKEKYYLGNNLVQFSPDYIVWCESIVKWIKTKYMTYNNNSFKGYRISSHTLNMMSDNKLKLSDI